MKNYYKKSIYIGTLLSASLLVLMANAQAVEVTGNSYTITIQDVPAEVTSIKVAAPGGFIYTAESLNVYAEDSFIDDDYQYELIGTLSNSQASQKQRIVQNAGRASDIPPNTPVGVIEVLLRQGILELFMEASFLLSKGKLYALVSPGQVVYGSIRV